MGLIIRLFLVVVLTVALWAVFSRTIGNPPAPHTPPSVAAQGQSYSAGDVDPGP